MNEYLGDELEAWQRTAYKYKLESDELKKRLADYERDFPIEVRLRVKAEEERDEAIESLRDVLSWMEPGHPTIRANAQRILQSARSDAEFAVGTKVPENPSGSSTTRALGGSAETRADKFPKSVDVG
jgi:hypothetical protein